MGHLAPILVCFACIGLAVPAPKPFKISENTFHSTSAQNGETFNVFIKMSQGTSSVLQKVRQNQYTTRSQRLDILHDELVNHAAVSQKKVLDYLSIKNQALNANEQMKVRGFWATNQIFVQRASIQLIHELLKVFPTEIEYIYPDEIVAEIQPVSVKSVRKLTKADHDLWGHRKIQTQEAWTELGIKNGQATKPIPEIRIATIDTGVRHTHEALRDNFLGEYGWYDPTIGELEPNDRMGHGSHTTATIVGSKGIGVVPWTKWMSCRGCPTMGCSTYDLISCGEFFVCPTLANGSSPDCSKAPHLISSSWSGGQGLDWYNEVVAAWHAAGIIPVFSIGNFGNAFCEPFGTANYPGDLPNVIGVGSTTQDDKLSWFSSVGPTLTGGSLIKPDVVAPGSDILSATNTADDDYVEMSGTSFSCPHVSGIVVLLLTLQPDITFEEARQAILSSAQHDLQSSNLTCYGIPDTEFPNMVFGNGRANALQSVLRIKL